MGCKAQFAANSACYWQEMQRCRTPEAALAQAVSGYAEHPYGWVGGSWHSGVRMSAIAAGCFRLIMGGLFRRLCKRASGSPHLARWAHAGYGVAEDDGAWGLTDCIPRDTFLT